MLATAWSDLHKVRHLAKFIELLFCIWQNFDPALAILSWYCANPYCCKWPNCTYDLVTLVSIHTEWIFKLTTLQNFNFFTWTKGCSKFYGILCCAFIIFFEQFLKTVMCADKKGSSRICGNSLVYKWLF